MIIPHFQNYPLITTKYSDFVLWCKVVELMVSKQHQTDFGFKTVLSYYASINKLLKYLKLFPILSVLIRNFPENLHPERVL